MLGDTIDNRNFRVKKTCQAYFVELIAVVSTPFAECQNLTRFSRYDQLHFRGSWLLNSKYTGNF